MEPVAKVKLIESLYKMLVSIGVLSPENVKVMDVCVWYLCVRVMHV
jgi:hypothetical protein